MVSCKLISRQESPLRCIFKKMMPEQQYSPNYICLKWGTLLHTDQIVPPCLLGMINNSSGEIQREPGMCLLSRCSKDTFLIWRHLKRSLKYVFICLLETKWVVRECVSCITSFLEDGNQVCLICCLGYTVNFGQLWMKIRNFYSLLWHRNIVKLHSQIFHSSQ